MQKIGIVGSGISAMGAAYFLRNECDITFFDKENYFGGHTNTLMIDEEGAQIPIDSAFMVFNRVTYPNMTRLFEELDVPCMNTNMSFSVQHKPSGLEYCGTGFNGLFADRWKLFSPRHWRMLMDISRFNKESLEVLDNPEYAGHSLQQYVDENGYGKDMVDKYLIPMSSAVWSTPPDKMLEFPAVTLVRFFKNHGFLGMNTQHQWETVKGGSEEYKKKIISKVRPTIYLNTKVRKVYSSDESAFIEDEAGKKHQFDKVIIGAHADEALAMLSQPTSLEKSILSKFPYQPNSAVLHTDPSVMPRFRRAWSSWNYRIKAGASGDVSTSTVYYMNSLQNVSKKQDYFISINEMGEIDRDKVIWEKSYTHPLFTVESQEAQAKLPELNDNGKIYFCGAYFRYGFHEDGLISGMDVARKILGRDVWS